MLQAVSSQGDYCILAQLPRQAIDQLKKSKTKFFCPICRNVLIIKAGLSVTPHFAHQSLENCPNRAQGEGVYHEKGKLDLYFWLKKQGYQVELESYLTDIKQRADLFIQLNQKSLAIEYQCATIPLKEILARTKGYQSIGITPFWILGGNRMRRLGNQGLLLTATEQSYLQQYPKDSMPKLLYYCPKTKKCARFNLACLSDQKRSVGHLQFSPLEITSFAHFFQHQAPTLFTPQWLFEKKRFRLKLPKHMVSQERKFREWLYLNQLFPSLISSWVGLPVVGQWQMKVSVWTWQAYLCYDFFNKSSRFSLDQLLNFVQPFRKNKPGLFPMLLKKDDPVLSYLDYLLIGKKVVKKQGVYYVTRKIGQYETVDQALKNDQLLHLYLKSKQVRSFKTKNEV